MALEPPPPHPQLYYTNSSFAERVVLDALLNASEGDDITSSQTDAARIALTGGPGGGGGRGGGGAGGGTSGHGSVGDGSGCLNATVFEQYIKGLVKNATMLTKAQKREIEGDPLVYIIAVLLFYSCGIAVLMINYMKKEQTELEESNLYKQYVCKRDRYDHINSRGKSLNRLALTALNAVNVISQDDQSARIAFV